jgi:beta-mannosidase
MNRGRCVEQNRRIAIVEGWQVAAAPAGSTLEHLQQLDWLPATVPGTAAGALRAAHAWSWDEPRKLDAEDFWWRARVTGDAGPAILGLDGIATLADVWLDGQHVLASDNMFIAHEVPIELHGEHDLVIRCRALTAELAIKRPRPRWRVPMLEHAQLRWIRTTLLGRTPGWSPPCPAIGPWRSVWIEHRSLQIGKIDLRSLLERSDAGDTGTLTVSAALDPRIERATLVVERGSERVEAPLRLHDGHWRGDAVVASPQLWWPHTHGTPALYAMSLQVWHDNRACLIDLGKTGFRNVEVDRGDGDDFHVRVNGVSVFCRGACWTPLDVVTLSAPAQAYRDAVAQARDAGMNMLRVGGTMVYEEDAFYDAADEQGMLVWQDLMFANMDYPDDAAFNDSVLREVDQQLARWQARACLALVCGNSEVEQQAAMGGAGRERWAPPLFHDLLAARVTGIGAAYTPSSTHGGAFPHAANAGPASYYGVGAYMRPLEDARRADVRFASECLAFANIPLESGLPGGASLRVHHALWKARSPRDLGAGWDFDDVRDHYVERLFRVDPTALRYADHDRYLALGRVATGEAMAQAFAEWRRARSPTRGGLVWFLRDLWPGAGWGLVDAHGIAKPCLHALRRVLSPIAIAITDEGVNGLAVHVFNDPVQALDARVELTLYRAGQIRVGHGTLDISVPGHASIELAGTAFFEGFLDLSHAYRFGPALTDMVRATLLVGDRQVAQTFWFPLGLPAKREIDVGLSAVAGAGRAHDERVVTISARCFAQSVMLDVPGFVADDAGFHIAPGDTRSVTLHATAPRREGRLSGTVTALNAESGARFDVP